MSIAETDSTTCTTSGVEEDTRRRVIYCHTNMVTGKKYVGQTTCRTPNTVPADDVVRRWRAGYENCRRFVRAIRKHGKAAFKHEVLEVVIGQDAANEAEPRWITQLGTLWPGGYNLEPGGAVTPHHPETCEKMREIWRNRSPEKKKESAKKRIATMGSQRISAAVRKGKEAMGQERRSAAAVKANESRTPEQRRAVGIKSRATLGPERVRELLLKASAASAARPAEQRRASALKREAGISPERRREKYSKRDSKGAAVRGWVTRRANMAKRAHEPGL